MKSSLSLRAGPAASTRGVAAGRSTLRLLDRSSWRASSSSCSCKARSKSASISLSAPDGGRGPAATVGAGPPPAPVSVSAGLTRLLDAEEDGAEALTTAAAGTRTRSGEANDSGWGLANVSLTYSVSLQEQKRSTGGVQRTSKRIRSQSKSKNSQTEVVLDVEVVRSE